LKLLSPFLKSKSELKSKLNTKISLICVTSN